MDRLKANISEGRRYRHLSQHERELILAGLAEGKSMAAIAKALARHPSTVARERARNLSVGNRYRYSPADAQRKYERRMARARRRPPLKCGEIRDYVERKLWARWSPQIIAGRLAIDHPGLKTNHESIYRYIYRYRRSMSDLLARSHKKRRKRGTAGNRRTQWGPRPSIELRDPAVDHRDQPGHWEADTMVCRSSLRAVAVAYERTTRLVRLRLLPRNTSRDFAHAISWALRTLPAAMRKTITYDNGSENVKHEQINTILGTRSYFCHPYTSWEKPGVEQCIGLLRQFIPKRTNLGQLTKHQIRYYQDLLNNRPRKCLGFRTPNERYAEIALPR